MKNAIKLFVAVALLSVAGIASAQNTASTPVTASARIIKPITINKSADLNFGNIIASAATLLIKKNATPLYTPAGAQPGSQTGTQNAAQFDVTLEPGFTFTIASTPAGGALTITDGAAHTAAVQLGAPTDAAGTTLSGAILSPTGSTSFWVGGTLTVTAGTVPGNYSNANAGGTVWTETVAY